MVDTDRTTSKPAEAVEYGPFNPIRIYCEGVKKDFPESAVWMNNILSLCRSGVLELPPDPNEDTVDELRDLIHDAVGDGEGNLGERSLLRHLKKHKFLVTRIAD